MTVTIGPYELDGPFESVASVRDRPGVWVAMSVYHGRRALVDIGESDDMRSDVMSRLQAGELRHADAEGGKLVYAVAYTHKMQADGRQMMLDEIRRHVAEPRDIQIDGNA